MARRVPRGTIELPIVMSERRYVRLDNEMIGLCRACGGERDTCEPDARNYKCPTCGEMQVFGVEELLAREEIAFTGGKDQDHDDNDDE